MFIKVFKEKILHCMKSSFLVNELLLDVPIKSHYMENLIT